MSQQQVALFDMDGTIANYDKAMRDSLVGLGEEPLPEDLHDEDLPDFWDARMDLIKGQPNWWSDLEPIKSGLSLLGLCHGIGFNIHILTQGPQRTVSAWTEKHLWCHEHVTPIAPDYGISITTRSGKGLHYGRVFVDDYPPYMLDWLANRPRGLGVMPEQLCNKGFKHPQVIKYNPSSIICGASNTATGWTTEFRDRLQAAYERLPGEE